MRETRHKMVGTRDLGMPSVQGRRSAGGTGLPAGDIGLSAGDIDTGLGAGKCQGRHCQGHSWREGSWVRPQRDQTWGGWRQVQLKES